MSELETIRERYERASSYFGQLSGVVLTTFNVNVRFLEEQALPAIFNAEGETLPTRRAEVHQRLGATKCTVFYDPSTGPQFSGDYRYVARPVPIRGKFFHPKIVVLAGRNQDDVLWVYLAVSSANLTPSGWGRNQESFGETWIHTRTQESWQELDDFLAWLQGYAPLAEEQTDDDGVAVVRQVLAGMPARKRYSTADGKGETWAGTLNARFYTSVVNTNGFPNYFQMGRSWKPRSLWAYSPFWGEVAEGVALFGAIDSCLFPARRIDGSSLGITKSQADELTGDAEIRRLPDDDGRYRHMKAYWIDHGGKVYTAVGSCNFTGAGLSGFGEGGGNAEAMLVYEGDPGFLPEGEKADPADFADTPEDEEDHPNSVPVAIVVAWDWREPIWRWWLEIGLGQRNFRLHLPGMDAFPVKAGTRTKQGQPPEPGATYTVTYQTDKGEQEWVGYVVELNLNFSSRVYGRELRANEILDSMRGIAPTWDIGGGGGSGDSENEDDNNKEAPAAFDAVNLYDLFRSTRALRSKLANENLSPEVVRAHLVGRPDSVFALALLADRSEEVPVVRYLVLLELSSIFVAWKEVLDGHLVSRVLKMTKDARSGTQQMLKEELPNHRRKAGSILKWFESQVTRLDREAGL